jgi:hypothetical protein
MQLKKQGFDAASFIYSIFGFGEMDDDVLSLFCSHFHFPLCISSSQKLAYTFILAIKQQEHRGCYSIVYWKAQDEKSSDDRTVRV